MLALPSSRLSVSILGLYLAQAVPLYLVAAALPPILRQNGIGLHVIGGMGLLLAPWVLKAAWAPLVDRVCRQPRIGRKRLVAACLAVTVLCILVLSVLNPVDDAAIFFPILMVMSLSSTTQDIASDGWTIEHLPRERQPAGSALQGSAVALGVIIGGAGTLFLYDIVGWKYCLWLMAGLTCLVVTPFFTLPEQADRRPMPQDAGRPSIRRFLAVPGAGVMLAFALIFRLPEGLVKALEQVFLVDQGFSLSQIGAISGVSAAAVGLLGAFSAALMIRIWGLIPFLVFLVVGRTLAFAMFYVAASSGIGTWPLVALSFVDTFLRYIEIVGLSTAFMRFSSLRQAGTDFTILTSATLLMYMIGGIVAGTLAELVGYGPVFLAAAILSLLTGWIAITLLPSGVRRKDSREETELPA